MSAPWMKFFPSDWRADPALRMCSIGARGLWMEMLCVMHEATPRGALVINGKALAPRQIAALAGCALDEAEAMIAELEDAGVFSRESDGTIISRRMQRDAEKEARDKANGKTGGNPNLKREKAGVNPQANPEDKAQKPEARSQIPDEDTGKPASSGAGQREVDLIEAERRCSEAAGSDRLGPFSPIAEILVGGHLDLDEVLTAIRARPARKGAVSSWKFYAKILNDRIAERAPSVASAGPPKVHVMSGTPEWDAWAAHEGRARPLDSKGGWSFPTRWPPQSDEALDISRRRTERDAA